MAEPEAISGVQIDARRRQIEITTLQRGKGRHSHYGSLNQAPPDVRGHALTLIREALRNAGYESLTDLEKALTSEVVVPEKESDPQADGKTEKPKSAKGARAAKPRAAAKR